METIIAFLLSNFTLIVLVSALGSGVLFMISESFAKGDIEPSLLLINMLTAALVWCLVSMLLAFVSATWIDIGFDMFGWFRENGTTMAMFLVYGAVYFGSLLLKSMIVPHKH